MTSPTVKLNTGAEIPLIGLGTWQSKPHEVASAVQEALKAGYRHIDCAWAYGNEEEVGQGIKASGIPREQIFITSKLWCTYHERVEENLDATLKKLGTDYLDLYLIHWPVALNSKGNHPVFPTLPDGRRDVDHNRELKDTWRQMEHVYKAGKVKAIGTSNFSRKKLEEIIAIAEVKPAANQLELHLYNPDHKLVEFMQSQGIVVEAYSPLGSTNSPLLSDEIAVAMSKKYNVSVATVLLGYLAAKNIVVIPKSVTPSRVVSNFQPTIDFAKRIDKADLAILDGVAANGKQLRLVMPPWGVDLGFDNWSKGRV